MTIEERNDIVRGFATIKAVERQLSRFPEHHRIPSDMRNDLIQDLYLYLLERVSDEVLTDLYLNSKHRDRYILAMCKRNVISKSSTFYYKYLRNSRKEISIEDYVKQEDNEESV